MLHGIEERTQPIPAKTYPFQVLWASGADKGKVAVRGGFVDYTSSDGTLYRIALATTTGLPDDTTALFTSNNYIRLDLDMSSESPGDWTLTAEAASAAHTTEADHFNWILARDISSVPGTDKAVLETHWAGGNILYVGGASGHVCKLKFYDDDEDEWSATHDDSATARWVPFAIYTPDDNPLATGQDVPDGEDWHCFKQQSMPSYEISSTGWQGSWAVLNFDIEVHYDASMDNWKSTGFGSAYLEGLVLWDSTEGKWRAEVVDGSWGPGWGWTSGMRSDAMPPEGNYTPSASLRESASSPSAMLTVTKL